MEVFPKYNNTFYSDECMTHSLINESLVERSDISSFIELDEDGHFWVTIDKDGVVAIFSKKPTKLLDRDCFDIDQVDRYRLGQITNARHLEWLEENWDKYSLCSRFEFYEIANTINVNVAVEKTAEDYIIELVSSRKSYFKREYKNSKFYICIDEDRTVFSTLALCKPDLDYGIWNPKNMGIHDCDDLGTLPMNISMEDWRLAYWCITMEVK